MKFEQLAEESERWLGPIDREGLAVILATVLSSKSKGPPLWNFVIAASGTGKTTFLTALPERFCVRASTLTRQSFVSGLHADSRADLVARLPGKCLVIQDLSWFLSQRDSVQREVFGLLRESFDHQRIEVPFGSVGLKVFEDIRFSLLAGCTRAIDSYRKLTGELGERFLILRLRPGKNAVSNSQAMLGQEAATSKALATILKKFVVEREPRITRFPGGHVTDEQDRNLAGALAWVRCPVPRDRQHHVTYRPDHEIETRLVKQFGELRNIGALVMDLPRDDIRVSRLVQRVARDTVPMERRELLGLLGDRMITTGKLVEILHLPKPTVREWLEDLWVLRILDKGRVNGDDLWHPSELFVEKGKDMLGTNAVNLEAPVDASAPIAEISQSSLRDVDRP